MGGTQADSIRAFVNTTYISPARKAGKKQVTVRAGDVHSAMKLKDKMPAVASALGATTFETTYQVRCTARTGPHNGANLTFTFEL
jgi:hypothetical protein